MINKAKKSLQSSIDAFLNGDISKVEETFKEEEVINELQKSIINYLLKNYNYYE